MKGKEEDYFSDDGGEFLSDEGESENVSSEERDSLLEKECEHLFVNEFSFCEDCGMKMEVTSSTFKTDVGYSEFHSKTTEIVTYDEIFSLTLPQEVKEKSIALLNQKGTLSSRSLAHRQEIFIAVMITYIGLISEGKEYEIPYDESLLLKELGLKLKHRTQIGNFLSGMSKCSLPIAEDTNLRLIIISPTQYIHRDCVHNLISRLSEKIKNFAKIIISKDVLGYILQDNPKHMSLAFIKIYMEMTKEKPISKFTKNNNISEGILKNKISVITEIIKEYSLEDII